MLILTQFRWQFYENYTQVNKNKNFIMLPSYKKEGDT